jgi:hypothetical protein
MMILRSIVLCINSSLILVEWSYMEWVHHNLTAHHLKDILVISSFW